MVGFKKVSYCGIEALRKMYLDSLYEAQELFLELIIENADYYIIEDRETIGYFIISPQDILVEYYLIPESLKDCEWIFKKIIETFNVEKVYCKSFDPLLLKCSLKYAVSHEIIGTLFRDYIETPPDFMAEFCTKKANEEDIPVLIQYTDELYESEEELNKLVKGGNIYIYYLDNYLIGCGFLTKIMNFYDIGMWINSDFRKRGYGTRIIANLKGYCLNNNMIPICGCDVDNIASKKILEKNGFISKHDLIQFNLPQGISK